MPSEKSTGDGIWTRVALLLKQRGESERAFGQRLFGNPSAIGRARTTSSVPAADRAILMAEDLGVSVEWLVLGYDREGKVSDPPAVPNQDPALDGALVSFLDMVRESDLVRWAKTTTRNETPTVAEAARALRVLQIAPQFSRSNGEPIEGWDVWFRKMRASNFAPPKGSARGTADATVAKAIDDPLGGHAALDPNPPTPKHRGRK